MDNFDLAFAGVIGLEGGYSLDPDDPGGETKYGIAKKYYPQIDIKNLTLDGAKQIYRTDYWNRLMLNQVNDWSAAEEIFEQGVNMGRVQAIEHIQTSCRLLGKVLVVDGFIGPKTIATVNAFGQRYDPFLKCMNGLQFMKYLEIVENKPTQKKYFVGWLRRVALAS